MTLTIKINEESIDTYRNNNIENHIGKAIALLPNNFVMIKDGCTRYIFDRKFSIPPNERKWWNFGEECEYYRKAIGCIYVRPVYKKNDPSHICSIEIKSDNANYDKVLKVVAVELAKYFDVEFIIAEYRGQNEKENIGSIRCKYCGQFTHNTEKCDYCSGVPI
jgi:hypothetical protein